MVWGKVQDYKYRSGLRCVKFDFLAGGREIKSVILMEY